MKIINDIISRLLLIFPEISGKLTTLDMRRDIPSPSDKGLDSRERRNFVSSPSGIRGGDPAENACKA